MAPKKDDTVSDDGIDFMIDSNDDEITAELRKALDDTDGSEDEDGAGGFELPLGETDPSVMKVSEDEGHKLIEAAQDAKSKPAKPDDAKPKAKGKGDDEAGDKKEEAKVEPDSDQAPAEAGKDAESAGEEKTPEVQRASDEDYSKALEGLTPEVRKRITETDAQLDEIMRPLRGREAELEARGTTPAGAMEWFININDYAGRDPGGYAAWALGESAQGDPAKIEAELQKAASLLGFKVTPATKGEGESDDEDDPFMTDREKELAAENRALKASQQRQSGPSFGPNSPEESARRTVMDVLTETDETGAALYPNFEVLMPQITALVGQERQQTGEVMTRESLIRAYEAAEFANPETRQAAIDRIAASKSAASTEADVRKDVQQKAAAAKKAEQASTKIVDGPGQGAGHQPADEDADLGLEDFLRKQIAAQASG